MDFGQYPTRSAGLSGFSRGGTNTISLLCASVSTVCRPVGLLEGKQRQWIHFNGSADSTCMYVASRTSKWMGWLFTRFLLRGAAIRVIIDTNRWGKLHKQGKTSILSRLFPASVTDGIGCVFQNGEFPWLYDVTKVVDFIEEEKAFFFSFKHTPALGNNPKIARRWVRWSEIDLRSITILLKWTRANCHFTVHTITSITHWNVLGAAFGHNGMRINLYSTWCDVTVVLSHLYASVLVSQ